MTSGTFGSFFDDAAIFPPGNAPLDAALARHVTRAATPDGRHVGPFACDTGRVGALLDSAPDGLAVSLVGAVDDVRPAAATLAGSALDLVAVEVLGPVESLPDMPAASIAVEMPWGAGFDVPDGAVLKLRCGGARVPGVDELAAAIVHCVERRQPFKLTAGLHAAIAHEGFHGFVNVMAAVVAASRAGDVGATLTAAAADLDLTTLAESRALFRSIGTCDIDEPLADLRALGLLPSPAISTRSPA